MNKLFYSWQSDLREHKAFMQACLEEAIRELPNYEIETTTRNSQGAVDITQTILKNPEKFSLVEFYNSARTYIEENC